MIDNEAPPDVLDEVPPVMDTVEEQGEAAFDPINDLEVKKAFEDLLRDAREEDRYVRDVDIRMWRRLEFYWNNILNIFMDPISRDWRVPNWDELEGEVESRLINIYRPHGEAIVAALSVTVPGVFFHPDDADNPDDVEAAKANRNIVDLLALHNDAPLLFIKVIVTMFNQGTVYGYNYYHKDPKFGTLSSPRIDFKDIQFTNSYCDNCGNPLDVGVPAQPQMGIGAPPASPMACDQCGYDGPPQVTTGTESLPQIVGYDHSVKGSVCQKIFSGLFVKVPAFVQSQEECGYLLLEFAQSVAMIRSIFKDRMKEIDSNRQDLSWEQFQKLPIQYFQMMPDNAVNVSCLWMRPWQFYQLGVSDTTIELVEKLVKNFPDGCYALFVNDKLMEVVPENMDEHWTISKNPLGNSIITRPLGENLSTIQDIRAQLVEIELQTAEYGIPETFADPRVLDFKKYSAGRAKPGMVTQAKAQAGKNIGDGFFQTKTANLSQEIDPLRQHIDQDAQFVVGSFPSVYGGPATGGSKTASEYSQSRAVALQRLGTTWKIAVGFWSQFQSRSAVEYATVLKEMGHDERFTKREGQSFVNVWIRSSELTGKIGRVEPESSEQLPTSWAQKKDAVSQLLQTGNEDILAVLTHPNNSTMMKEIVGLADFYIPGEEDRLRQFKEFAILSQGQYVPVNALIDNHEIHMEVLKYILEGPLADELDENGKMLCMQHFQEHMMIMMQNAAQQPQESAPDASSEEGQEQDNG